MAILQGLIALLTRSLGSVFDTAFGWAVVALFGQTTPKDKTLLSVVVGAAAAWPLLLIGVVFPKLAAFFIALVPLSSNVPSSAVRPIWIGLAAVVPIGVGIAVHLHSRQRRSIFKDALSGFRVTLGLALSFVFNLVSAPVLRLWSLIHMRSDVHIAVITEPAKYGEVAKGLRAVWDTQGLGLLQKNSPFWLTFPTRILSIVAGDVFKQYIPAEPAFFEGEDIQAALYANDLLLRGKSELVSHAAAAAVEAMLALPALQTIDSGAQDLERRIQKVLRSLAGSSADSAEHRGGIVDQLTRAARESPMPLLDSQVIYRELLQLARAVEGHRQLFEELAVPEVEPVTAAIPLSNPDSPPGRRAGSARQG